MARQRHSVTITIFLLSLTVFVTSAPIYSTKSGILTWIDPATPRVFQSHRSSRGQTWTLVMSDEFNSPQRSFRPGQDHLWTSIEKSDGTNGALEMYTHNMTATECDAQNETCFLAIQVRDKPRNVSVYNLYANPPQYRVAHLFYESGMVQSWNKFCFQGGFLEVRAQLPGAMTKESGNPDLQQNVTASKRVSGGAFYPTWPGIWLMGNLGRAIFSGSTNRMWPFSYNRCEPKIFDPDNQRISACNANPGFGLRPKQGRGAPEIDVMEGGGSQISTSMQIAPGMPSEFRIFPPNLTTDNDTQGGCAYIGTCRTLGANYPGVPSAFYAQRQHNSWYQGLRYAANPFCDRREDQVQSIDTIQASMSSIVNNTCSLTTCPASHDGYSDISAIDNTGLFHWGINSNGTCFAILNRYTGAFLCDPDNQNPDCPSPRPSSRAPTHAMHAFAYQMDAISANWDVHLDAYTDYVVYQLEWVTGSQGYLRWMIDGHVVFEVTADAIENIPQDHDETNPRKLMIEEPMSLIINVALSTTWSAKPTFTDRPCRGNGSDPAINRICDAFPMKLKIDYIRIYQDTSTDRASGNLMQIGCDPASHPTREWILGHDEDYTDANNPIQDVQGGAFCRSHDDCTLGMVDQVKWTLLITGKCVRNRCQCIFPHSWGGPRCIAPLSSVAVADDAKIPYGPPMELAMTMAGVAVIATAMAMRRSNLDNAVRSFPAHRPPGLEKPRPLVQACAQCMELDELRVKFRYHDTIS